MNEYPRKLKEELKSIIRQMSSLPELFSNNPSKDFTRNRKLPFEAIVQMIISMGGNSIYKELLEHGGYDIKTATTSAFVQQRSKILPLAFEYLLHEFIDSCSEIQKYKGYRLLAVDGSDLHIATNPNAPDTYFQNRPGEKGFSLMRLNAGYDLCSHLYLDAILQPSKLENERQALITMVERSHIDDNVIIVSDRGYESYNLFAHIENKNWNYLIRVKDINSNGILSACVLPDEDEFDVCVSRIFTRKQTKTVMANPDIYKFLPSNQKFEFLPVRSSEEFQFSFRVVRIRINDDSFETLITNLSKDKFNPDDLKKIYNMSWGIETSFRDLKYTVGLTNFHAKKQEFIAQEVFARIIMYNFVEMIILHVVISKTETQYFYQVNFNVAFHVCVHFLRLHNNEPPPDVEALIRNTNLS